MRDGESSDSDSEYGYGYFTECSESSADRTPSHRCSSCDSRSDLSDTDEDSRSDSSEDGGRSCDEGQDQEERDPPEARVEPEKEKVHVHHEPEENQVRAGPHPEGRGEAGPGPGADEAGLHENARRYDADPAVAIRTIAGLPSCPPSRSKIRLPKFILAVFFLAGTTLRLSTGASIGPASASSTYDIEQQLGGFTFANELPDNSKQDPMDVSTSTSS